MPDLLTHTLSAALVHKPFQKRTGVHFLLFFVAGNMLPDIVSRVPMILMPEWTPFFEPYHTILGSTLWILVFIQFFREKISGQMFLPLFSGTLLHFFLDSFQKNIFGVGYRLFYPLEAEFGFGIIWPEDSVYFLPVLVLLVFLFYRKKFARPQGKTLPENL